MKYFYSETTKGRYVEGYYEALPEDALEISEEKWKEIGLAQSNGKEISIQDGEPVSIDPPPPTQNELIKKQIVSLEEQQDARRIREAVLGIDGGWLANIDAQIEALRAQLGGE